MKKRVLISVIGLLCVFISCSNGSEDSSLDNSSLVIAKLDIVDAKSLYISSSNSTDSARSVNSDSSAIFKITKNGYVREVKYYDSNDSEVTISEQPTVINVVNDDYIFVAFGWSADSISSSYLVRKSDGAVFSLENAGTPEKEYNNFKNSPLIKADKNNNIYFRTFNYANGNGKSAIAMVNLSGIENLSASIISATTDSVEYFETDWNGNIIYTGSLLNDGNWSTRIRKGNGGLLNLNNNDYWIGLDGCIYYISSKAEDSKESEYEESSGTWIYYMPIRKVNIDSNYNVYEELLYAKSDFNLNRYWSYKLELENRILIISNEGSIIDLGNSTILPHTITLSGLAIKNVNAVAHTDNYYFIAGSDSNNNTFLIKIDAFDDKYTNLLTQNDYDVYLISASESDGVIFNALRMSDGKKIIAKVNLNGDSITMLDEESDLRISYLERIN